MTSALKNGTSLHNFSSILSIIRLKDIEPPSLTIFLLLLYLIFLSLGGFELRFVCATLKFLNRLGRAMLDFLNNLKKNRPDIAKQCTQLHFKSGKAGHFVETEI